MEFMKNTDAHASLYPHIQFALFISAITCVFVSCSHSVTGSTSTALINLLQEGTYDGDCQMMVYCVCIMKNF